MATLASECVPLKAPRELELPAMKHDNCAHECEADHLGVVRAAAAPMQTSSMVRLSMSQLCMTRKNASKEGCYTDRDKWLEAYRTGRHSRKHTRTHTNTHTHKHTHTHTHTPIQQTHIFHTHLSHISDLDHIKYGFGKLGT